MNEGTTTMRKLLLFGALVGAGILMLSAPALAEPATDRGTSSVATESTTLKVTLTPSRVRAGERVTVFANCGHGENFAGSATSSAFGTVPMSPTVGGYTADAVVPTSTEPGRYLVTVTCGERGTGATGTATLVVTKAQTTTVPKGGVDTGGGGTASGTVSPGRLGFVLVVVGLVAALAAALRRATHA